MGWISRCLGAKPVPGPVAATRDVIGEEQMWQQQIERVGARNAKLAERVRELESQRWIQSQVLTWHADMTELHQRELDVQLIARGITGGVHDPAMKERIQTRLLAVSHDPAWHERRNRLTASRSEWLRNRLKGASA